MRKSYWISQHGTQNVKTHNRTTQKNWKDKYHGPHQKPGGWGVWSQCYCLKPHSSQNVIPPHELKLYVDGVKYFELIFSKHVKYELNYLLEGVVYLYDRNLTCHLLNIICTYIYQWFSLSFGSFRQNVSL